MPVLVINDSPIKQFAENTHAVGQSVLEVVTCGSPTCSTQGKRVVVFGYGSVGRGVARRLPRQLCAGHGRRIGAGEADSRRCLDGFDVSDRDVALARADVIITVTGAPGVLTADDAPLLKDGVLLMNAGHFPHEIDVAGLGSAGPVAGWGTRHPEHPPSDGRVHPRGGPGRTWSTWRVLRPLGNSIESMDLGFALQSRCLESNRSRAGWTGCDGGARPRRGRRGGSRGYLRTVVGVTAPDPSTPDDEPWLQDRPGGWDGVEQFEEQRRGATPSARARRSTVVGDGVLMLA